MSRKYQIDVTARDVNQMDAVKSWLRKEWDFDEPLQFHQTLYLSGVGRIVESEEQFADRIAEEVWAANGQYCKVEVEATCLENLPCEIYHRGRAEYAVIMKEEN